MRRRRSVMSLRNYVRPEKASMRFKPLDYCVFGIGLVGTLKACGLLTNMPRILVVVLGVLSSFICCFSILLLAFNRFIPHLDRPNHRLHVFYVFSNLVPTIYLFSRLTETPREYFMP
jgi:hypothetical protein